MLHRRQALDRIHSMEAFVRVVDDGSFTKAAARLDLAPSSITRLVQALETSLQVKLLNRTTRRVSLTTDGVAYYERVVRVLGEFQELESITKNAQARLRGRLRVEVGASVGHMLLIPALPEFFEKYPDIQLELGVSDRPIDLMNEGVDCVLRGGPIIDDSLVARRIGLLQSQLVASPAYLAQHGTPVHPLDLESDEHLLVNFISHRVRRPFPFELSRDDERYEIQGRHILAVDDMNATLVAATSGLGVAALPSFMCSEAAALKKLVPLMSDWRLSPIPIHVIYAPNRHLSTRVRVFVDWVSNLFSQIDKTPAVSAAEPAADAERATFTPP